MSDDPYTVEWDALAWRYRMDFGLGLSPRTVTRRVIDQRQAELDRAWNYLHGCPQYSRAWWRALWGVLRADWRVGMTDPNATYTYSDPRQFMVLTGLTS